MLPLMKLQIFILAVGVAVSAGAVTAEINRVPTGTAVTRIISASVTAESSSPKRATANKPISVPQTAPARSVTKVSTALLSGVKPSITGISSEENDN